MKGQAAQAGAESPRSSSGRHSWRQEKDGARTLTMMHEVLQPAKDEGKGTYRFDIRLQGEGETVFLEFQ